MHCLVGYRAQFFGQAKAINCAQLVEQNQAADTAMSDGDAKGRLVTARGHGRDHRCSQMGVHLVWRDHNARPSFADFPAARWV
jgi:hypothetical protein